VNQIYSSGNDFNTFRMFNQLFLKRRYTRGEGLPRWASNLIITIALLISIGCAFIGQMILGTLFLVIYLVAMYFNNNVKEYKESWNGYPDTHNLYV